MPVYRVARRTKAGIMSHRPSPGLGFFCRTVAAVFAVLSFSATPALAGFEWVAPPAGGMPGASPGYSAPAPVSPAPMQGMPAPAASQNPEVISPVVIEGNPLSPAGESAPSAAAPPSESAMPVPPMTSGGLASTTATATAAAMPAPAMAGKPVLGFADNVPLAVALRQLLPPGYDFSIDSGVDMGTLVSFQGGQPWRQTLAGMLRPAGLAMREQGHTVFISYPAAGTMPAAAPAPMPQAPMPSMPAMPAARRMTPSYHFGAMNGMANEATPGAMAMPGAAPYNAASNAAEPVMAWRAARGATLHKVLADWCQRADVELDWLAEYDYPLQASVSIDGSFEDAVRNILSGFEQAHPQPIAELHNDTGAGQKVLVVQTRGNAYNND